ncbi:MAG: LuxR C-terminal-related transcriptional regulator [Burkholderiaceae bacterium]
MHADPSFLFEYQTIFLRAPVGMCVSEQRVIVAGNEALERMFGYPPAALAGQSFRLLYPSDEEFERIGVRIVSTITETGKYADERIMRRADGELFWCHVTGATLVPGNPHAAAIWTFEDLSARRSVSAELTPREREIASLLVEGKTSKQIARQIALSPRTVEMHRSRLMRKFNATTAGELLNRLLDNGQ